MGQTDNDKSHQSLKALKTFINLVNNKDNRVVMNVEGHTHILAELLNPHPENRQ